MRPRVLRFLLFFFVLVSFEDLETYLQLLCKKSLIKNKLNYKRF